MALAGTRKEAEEIQRKLDRLGRTNANPTITLDGGRKVIRQFNAVQQLIHDVTGTKGGITPPVGSLSGLLGGHDYAAGGYTGAGGKYEPAGVAHKREYVFSSEATQGNEAYLDTLHRTLRGYAGGGLVGSSAPAPAALAPAIEYELLGKVVARNVATIRPMYGDVTIQPHSSVARWSKTGVRPRCARTTVSPALSAGRRAGRG